MFSFFAHALIWFHVLLQDQQEESSYTSPSLWIRLRNAVCGLFP
jgi:hypothetical protein